MKVTFLLSDLEKGYVPVDHRGRVEAGKLLVQRDPAAEANDTGQPVSGGQGRVEAESPALLWSPIIRDEAQDQRVESAQSESGY